MTFRLCNSCGLFKDFDLTPGELGVYHYKFNTCTWKTCIKLICLACVFASNDIKYTFGEIDHKNVYCKDHKNIHK